MEQLVDNRYRIVEPLGSGGMAYVYLAHDDVLDRDVALKVMSGAYVGDEEFVERFKREAQNAAALSHPNIVSIYDRGGTGDGSYYIAMEYLPGGTLKDRILKRGALPARTAAEVACQIAEALQVAHKSGVVHRDIKPHNILITESGDIKVTDFGIARAAASSTMTRTGSILGTAHYISPEQAMGEPVGPASDLYSLGVVLYEMLTGQLPYDADTPIGLAMKHVNGHLREPIELDPSIPEGINAVTLRLMSKNPDDRYQSDAELIEDLERVSEGFDPAGATTQMMKTRGVSPATRVGGPSFSTAAPRPDKRRRRIWPVVLALFLISVLALLGWAGYNLLQDIQEQNAPLPVPDLVGMTLDEAEGAVGEGFDLSVEDRVESEEPVDTILEQDPAAGAEAERGSDISVVVVGTQVAEVPEVGNLERAAAQGVLSGAGFEVQVRERESSSEQEGLVISQSPEGGERVEVGSEVTITVGSGPSTVEVPELAGNSPAQARGILAGSNLSLGAQSSAPSNEFPEGAIISQNPSAGTSVEPGTAVDVTISSGPEQIAVPDVTGQSAVQAQQTLQAAGLNVNRSYTRERSSQPVDTVLRTNPPAGTTVEVGTTVSLVASAGPPPPQPNPRGGSGRNQNDNNDNSLGAEIQRDVQEAVR